MRRWGGERSEGRRASGGLRDQSLKNPFTLTRGYDRGEAKPQSSSGRRRLVVMRGYTLQILKPSA